MKTINQDELLSLNDKEKAKILKEICLGRIKYIGKDKKMSICLRCSKFGACKKASEEIKDCSDFEKRHYDTKLVKIEDGTYYFEGIFRLYVDNWPNEEFAFCIKAEKPSDNMICACLGEYETEARAKEILQEIWEFYETVERYKSSNGMAIVFEKSYVYEMPKE